MATLQEIRAKLQQSQRNTTSTKSGGASLVFPHWNADFDTTQIVRFLPDEDDQNPYFWRMKSRITLAFQETDDKNQKTQITIPCMETWGDDKCPLKSIASQQYQKNATTAKSLGIWPKKSYYYNALIVQSTITEETPPSPIRLVIATSQLQKIIETVLLDGEVANLPTDYKLGRDFRVKKTKKGEYADYTTSGFAMKERALTDDEMTILAQHPLHNLLERMGKKPTTQELDDYVSMMEAYVDGQPFDSGQWGKYLSSNS